jgi:hypothetical protein
LISRQVDHYKHKPIIAQGLPARATTRPIVAAEGPHPDPGPIFLANQRVRSSSPSRVFDERVKSAPLTAPGGPLKTPVSPVIRKMGYCKAGRIQPPAALPGRRTKGVSP